jgi:hypothetical protein
VTIIKQPVGTDGGHRVEFREPRDPQFNQVWFATSNEACAAYAEFGEDGPDGRVTGSGLWRVRLIVDGQLEGERLVVRARPNYL